MLPMTWPLLKMIWNVHFKLRPRLLDLVSGYRTDKQVFHIRSPHQMRQFIELHEIDHEPHEKHEQK